MDAPARIAQIIDTVEQLASRINACLENADHPSKGTVHGLLLYVASYLIRLKNDNPALYDEVLERRLEGIKEPLKVLGNWQQSFTEEELLTLTEQKLEQLKRALE